LEEKAEQLQVLRSMANRQREEIRLLQKAASEVGRAVPPAESCPAATPAPMRVPAEAAPARANREPIVPLWKDSLNSILSMLDELENETKN